MAEVNINIVRNIAAVIIGLILTSAFPSYAAQGSLLLHTSEQPLPALPLSAQQSAWLQNKHILQVGVSPTDAPPYTLSNRANQLEGISAEYIALIARQLGLTVNIVTYDNSDQVWRALAKGDIDIIPSITQLPASNRFELSTPYASDQPILAVKNSDNQTLPADLNNVRLAASRDYLSFSQLQKAYPRARIQIYDSYQEAMSAVAFGNSRVFLGNSYHIGRNYLNNLRLEGMAALPERTVSFAMQRSNVTLNALINDAIKHVPMNVAADIRQFWQSGYSGSAVQQMTPLALTATEQRWVASHPVVKVLLYGKDNTAPVAFIDQDGSVRGIAIDVLALVGLKTGLRFTFSSNDSLASVADEVNTRNADMIAALAPSAERQKSMDFTVPYTRSAFALITAANNQSIQQLADMRGKKLALVRHAALDDYIRQHYPDINITYFDSDKALYDSVASGDMDATIGLLITADYQLANRYRGKLKIANTIGNFTAYIVYAVGKADPELHSILNKVLITIPPDELELLANRWRPNNMVVIDSFWMQHRTKLLSGAGIVLLLLLIAIGRTLWLRRQMKLAAQQQQQLASQLLLMEKLIDGMPYPISLRTLEGQLTYCNHLYEIYAGTSFDQLKNRTLADTPGPLQPEQVAFFQQKMQQVIATREPYSGDHLLASVQDKAASVMTNFWIMPWLGQQDEVLGVVAGMWDVSERHRLVQQLSETSDRAEASNRAKSTFLSTMSHEIRTPMNAIIGMLDMAIRQGKQGKQDIPALEVAYQSAEGLVGLIGDILDLSRIEGGHLEFRPEPVNLVSLIDQLLVIFNGLALDKNILLEKRLPTAPVASVIGDPLRIKQVLSNLLSNAIKFTDQGKVSLTLSCAVEKDKNHFIIEVQDSGTGIKPEQLAALFKPFAQADNRRAGTGLGLYISRTLCESMEGTLTLTSQPGYGTCARAEFSLPLAGQAVNTERREQPIIIAAQAMNILVVDDNNANRILLAKQLAWLGHHAHVATNGQEGYAMWQTTPFDLIITDCNMPGMNGFELTQKIRAEEVHLGRTRSRILGFTANAMHEIYARCQAAGMDDCLLKPCSLSTLSEMLNRRGAV